jgi:hypothetical protein
VHGAQRSRGPSVIRIDLQRTCDIECYPLGASHSVDVRFPTAAPSSSAIPARQPAPPPLPGPSTERCTVLGLVLAAEVACIRLGRAFAREMSVGCVAVAKFSLVVALYKPAAGRRIYPQVEIGGQELGAEFGQRAGFEPD